jgi:CubicO group peptidase (beta-lactamase class C family)
MINQMDMLRHFTLPLVILSSCFLSISQVKGQNTGLDEKSNSDLNDLFAQEFKSNEPGGAVLILKGDQVVFSGNYGLADLGTKEAIYLNTVFNTGSISKTFVANGILILQERGLLSIEDSIDKYFDDFENKEISSEVKIKHLLSHTSGLPDIRRVRSNVEFFLTAKDEGNFDPIKGAEKLNFDPGERFEYSNPAFNGLALIIQKVTGKRWQQFIIDNIFTPCEMALSKITDGPHPTEGVSHGYISSGQTFSEQDYGETPTFAASGNGGVWSTVLELAKYELCIQNSIFLQSESVNSSRSIYNPEEWTSDQDPHLGWGWFLGEKSLLGDESNLGVDIVYHTGSQGGFRAYMISIPEKNILSIGLFNRPVNSYRDFMSEPLKILAAHDWLD